MRRLMVLAALAALTASLVAATAASAARPESEREIVGPETFYDDVLSEACGVDVWTTATRFIIRRAFGVDPHGAQWVSTVSISLVAQAGDNTFRFRDVGADVVQQTADGVLTLLIIGQVLFSWTGVLKIDLATDELVHEPHWVDATRACAALTE